MKWPWIRFIVLLEFGIPAALAADFSGANLSGAHLTNADLRGSNLSGANLNGANLSGTDLTGTNVTQQQLDAACGSGTKLAAGLKIKPCPTAVASASSADRAEERASPDSVQPEEDHDASSGISTEAPPEAKITGDSSQPSERGGVLPNSALEVLFRAGSQ